MQEIGQRIASACPRRNVQVSRLDWSSHFSMIRTYVSQAHFEYRGYVRRAASEIRELEPLQPPRESIIASLDPIRLVTRHRQTREMSSWRFLWWRLWADPM